MYITETGSTNILSFSSSDTTFFLEISTGYGSSSPLITSVPNALDKPDAAPGTFLNI